MGLSISGLPDVVCGGPTLLGWPRQNSTSRSGSICVTDLVGSAVCNPRPVCGFFFSEKFASFVSSFFLVYRRILVLDTGRIVRATILE